MMGLPAYGKSTLAKRIQYGLEQLGLRVGVFNNGELRRAMLGLDTADPEFFNPNNEYARKQRENLAITNMQRAKAWLAQGGDVAIIDATHGSTAQRELLRTILNDYPVLFVECVNNDNMLLEESLRRKIRLPEFAGLPPEKSMTMFRQRIKYYESIYAPLTQNELCWMRVDSVDNRILAESPMDDLSHYTAIRDIMSLRWIRNLYLVRHGETQHNLENRVGGDSPLTESGIAQAEILCRHFHGVDIPYIFTSSLTRSVMSAQQMLSERKNTTFMAFPEFNEIHSGICENMSYQDIREKMPEEYAERAKDKYGYVYPDGEGYTQLRDRVGKGLRRALFLAGEGALMIIGHQAVNRTLLSLLLYQRPDDVPYTYIPQNQYYHISITLRRKLFEMIRFL
jgi:broad specificity phosphatase PhoE/predicted kinase